MARNHHYFTHTRSQISQPSPYHQPCSIQNRHRQSNHHQYLYPPLQSLLKTVYKQPNTQQPIPDIQQQHQHQHPHTTTIKRYSKYQPKQTYKYQLQHANTAVPAWTAIYPFTPTILRTIENNEGILPTRIVMVGPCLPTYIAELLSTGAFYMITSHPFVNDVPTLLALSQTQLPTHQPHTCPFMGNIEALATVTLPTEVTLWSGVCNRVSSLTMELATQFFPGLPHPYFLYFPVLVLERGWKCIEDGRILMQDLCTIFIWAVCSFHHADFIHEILFHAQVAVLMGASAHPHEMLIMDGLLADLADGLLGAI